MSHFGADQRGWYDAERMEFVRDTWIKSNWVNWSRDIPLEMYLSIIYADVISCLYWLLLCATSMVE